MGKGPLATIMIPTFNRPEYFRLALESALSQTYPYIEIVVSDDSTDHRTEKLIQPYLSRYLNVKYVHHVGFSARDNMQWVIGYDNPETQYLTWLMDDDMIAPQKIERMIDYYNENEGIALVASYRKVMDAENRILEDTQYTKPAFSQTSVISGKEAGKLLMYNLTNYIGEFSAALMRKDYFQSACMNFGFAGTALPDVSLWLRMLQMGDLIYINEPLSYLRLHTGQYSQSAVSRLLSMAGWYELVQYAWQNKIYLETVPEARKAILRCLSIFVNVLSEFADKDLLGQIENNSDLAVKDIPEDLWEKVHRMMGNLAEALRNGYILPKEDPYPGTLILEIEDIKKLPWYRSFNSVG